MKLIIKFIVISTIMFFSCKNEKKPVVKKNQISLKKVHSLIDSQDEVIGQVMIGNMVNDTLFKELYVINNSDTIYCIRDNFFMNKDGVDFEIYSENFSGFYLVHKASDYIVIGGTFNEGKDISDNLTIEWNSQKEQMSLLKLP